MSRIIYICCICWKRNGTSSSRIRLFSHRFIRTSFWRFFIPENQNVCILKNLRYMPLLMHSHQFIEINYVLKSDHSLLIDAEKSTPLQDGDIILCPPNLQHTFQTQNKTASLLISFYVSQHLILFSFIYWITIIIYPHCFPMWFTEILTAILSGTVRMTLH